MLSRQWIGAAHACALFAGVPLHAQAPAELVFRGGRIYTAQDRSPVAEAVAVRGDRIVYVGPAAGASRFVGPRTRVIELGGRILVPGLADAHAHLAGIGARELTLNLEGTRSLTDLLSRIEARARQATRGEWITGRGWIETHWQPPRFPTRDDLDRVSPDNPVYLERADGHAGVANSPALRLAGVTRNTPVPPGGAIHHDDRGEPTGMLVDNARALVERIIPEPSEAELERMLITASERSVRLGWTQVHDAGGLNERNDWDEVGRLRRLFRDGRIKLRIYKAVYGPGPAADSVLLRGPAVGEFGGRFTLRTIKVQLDGALGSRGALLRQPYADAPEAIGLIRVDLDRFRQMLRRALQRGVQVETHAIGDSANRLVLDAYAEAFAAVPPGTRGLTRPRWRVEHVQVITPDDAPRFRTLGIIASMQPSHAISDLHFAPARLGSERVAGAYAWRTLLESGATIAGGSDAPVERGEPMIEFYAAVARRDTAGFQGPDWHPNQAVTREQALKMFTAWPAYAAFEEKRRGTIEVGKWADLTVLSADIMRIPAPEILRTRAVMTVIGGELVHEEK
jgi:predicted amidohydrolase YtcJ